MEEKEGSAEEARVVGSAAVKAEEAAAKAVVTWAEAMAKVCSVAVKVPGLVVEAELVETVVVVMVVAAAEMEVEEAVTAEVGVPAVVVSSEASRAVDWTVAG